MTFPHLPEDLVVNIRKFWVKVFEAKYKKSDLVIQLYICISSFKSSEGKSNL